MEDVSWVSKQILCGFFPLVDSRLDARCSQLEEKTKCVLQCAAGLYNAWEDVQDGIVIARGQARVPIQCTKDGSWTEAKMDCRPMGCPGQASFPKYNCEEVTGADCKTGGLNCAKGCFAGWALGKDRTCRSRNEKCLKLAAPSADVEWFSLKGTKGEKNRCKRAAKLNHKDVCGLRCKSGGGRTLGLTPWPANSTNSTLRLLSQEEGPSPSLLLLGGGEKNSPDGGGGEEESPPPGYGDDDEKQKSSQEELFRVQEDEGRSLQAAGGGEGGPGQCWAGSHQPLTTPVCAAAICPCSNGETVIGSERVVAQVPGCAVSDLSPACTQREPVPSNRSNCTVDGNFCILGCSQGWGRLSKKSKKPKARDCLRAKCTCQNGAAKEGCTQENKELCGACKLGYALDNGKCVSNLSPCTCANGMPVSVWKKCVGRNAMVPPMDYCKGCKRVSNQTAAGRLGRYVLSSENLCEYAGPLLNFKQVEGVAYFRRIF